MGVVKAAGNRGKGRKKGVPNKVTGSIKAVICEAFHRIKVDKVKAGVDSFVAWGNDNQTEFYKLWARLAPQQVDMRVTDIGEQLRLARERIAND